MRKYQKKADGAGKGYGAVAPGFVQTDMLRSVPKEIMEKTLSGIPLRRLGKPAGVAGAVTYLLSEI